MSGEAPGEDTVATSPVQPQAFVVLCTAPATGDHAARLAKGLVAAELAACVNVIDGIRSFYRWDGAIQDDAEVQLVIKTRAEHFDAIAAWLAEHHPYDVPEVLALCVDRAAPAYLAWLLAATAGD